MLRVFSLLLVLLGYASTVLLILHLIETTNVYVITLEPKIPHAHVLVVVLTNKIGRVSNRLGGPVRARMHLMFEQ